MTQQDRAPPTGKSVHGHTGPTTPGEEASREAPLTDAEKARAAEETSREEDA